MYKGLKISLVLPAYNEEKNIRQALSQFQKLNILDEIIVVNNNSKDRTAQIAKEKHVKVVLETKQGYGFAIRRGLKEANGDLVVLCEPDGTFKAQDLANLLSYTKDYDLVMGTRTNKKFIDKGANMGPFLRLGNIAVAKLMQLLYGLNSISDCGCTFRVFRKATVIKILPHLTIGSSHFLPETVIMTKLAGGNIKEIPVQYRIRIGQSKITGSFIRSVKVGLNMVGVILSNKLSPPKLNL